MGGRDARLNLEIALVVAAGERGGRAPARGLEFVGVVEHWADLVVRAAPTGPDLPEEVLVKANRRLGPDHPAGTFGEAAVGAGMLEHGVELDERADQQRAIEHDVGADRQQAEVAFVADVEPVVAEAAVLALDPEVEGRVAGASFPAGTMSCAPSDSNWTTLNIELPPSYQTHLSFDLLDPWVTAE